MQITASELAAILNGKLEGDPNVAVNRPSKIEEGGEGSISFLGNLKYEQHLYSTTASVVIIPNSLTLKTAISATIIRVEDVYQSLGILLKKFENQGQTNQGIHALAFVHEGADIHPEASIAPFAYIGKNVRIEKGCQIGAHVFIGEEVKIGEGSKVYPGAVIYQACEIGQSCIIHSNAVIGSDGFGFSPREDGGYDKIPQVGNVILENDVEIGANTVIDRASIGHTVIKQGVKLDNLIQIAHNVEIGQNTVIAAQAGIAGSTKLGKGCRIGGQAGFVGHIEVADGSMVQAQSGVAQALTTPKGAYYGSPAIGYRDYLKSYALFKRLPDLQKQIKALEAKVKALEADKK